MPYPSAALRPLAEPYPIDGKPLSALFQTYKQIKNQTEPEFLDAVKPILIAEAIPTLSEDDFQKLEARVVERKEASEDNFQKLLKSTTIDGIWGDGMRGRATISGDELLWHNGGGKNILLTRTDTTLTLILQEDDYTATLKADGRLYWSDHESWTRREFADDKVENSSFSIYDDIPAKNLCSLLSFCEQATQSEISSRIFSGDRGLVKPFLDFIWLLMKSLALLPPGEMRTCFLAVKGNLKDDYPIGKEFCWHGFVSTTPDEDDWNLELVKRYEADEELQELKDAGEKDLEQDGKKDEKGAAPEACTIFRIELTQKQARDVSKYAVGRKEILLPPGCRFKVINERTFGEERGLNYIHLKEVRSLQWITDLWPKDTSDSIKEIIRIFCKIDLDENQRLSKEELAEVMVDIGMEKDSAEKVIELADKDMSGDLDFAEFVGWIFNGTADGGDSMAKAVKAKLGKQTLSGDLQAVAVNMMSGDSHELKVPQGIKASELRALVAELVGIPKLETGLLDDADGTLIFFGNPKPMEAIPESVTLIRSKKWAGVPEGLHSESHTISEDRCCVRHTGEYDNAGCYLTAALDRGSRYSIDVALEMDYNVHCVWLGVTSDRMTKWGYLEGCFFSSAGGYWRSVWDCFFEPSGGFFYQRESPDRKTKVYDVEKMDSILNAPDPKKLRVVLDLRSGTLELRTQEDELIVQHDEPEFLVEDALRMCFATLEPGAAITIEGCQAN